MPESPGQGRVLSQEELDALAEQQAAEDVAAAAAPVAEPAPAPPPYDPAQDTQGMQIQPNYIAPAPAPTASPDASAQQTVYDPALQANVPAPAAEPAPGYIDTGVAPPESTQQTIALEPAAPPPEQSAEASRATGQDVAVPAAAAPVPAPYASPSTDTYQPDPVDVATGNAPPGSWEWWTGKQAESTAAADMQRRRDASTAQGNVGMGEGGLYPRVIPQFAQLNQIEDGMIPRPGEVPGTTDTSAVESWRAINASRPGNEVVPPPMASAPPVATYGGYDPLSSATSLPPEPTRFRNAPLNTMDSRFTFRPAPDADPRIAQLITESGLAAIPPAPASLPLPMQGSAPITSGQIGTATAGLRNLAPSPLAQTNADVAESQARIKGAMAPFATPSTDTYSGLGAPLRIPASMAIEGGLRGAFMPPPDNRGVTSGRATGRPPTWNPSWNSTWGDAPAFVNPNAPPTATGMGRDVGLTNDIINAGLSTNNPKRPELGASHQNTLAEDFAGLYGLDPYTSEWDMWNQLNSKGAYYTMTHPFSLTGNYQKVGDIIARGGLNMAAPVVAGASVVAPGVGDFLGTSWGEAEDATGFLGNYPRAYQSTADPAGAMAARWWQSTPASAATLAAQRAADEASQSATNYSLAHPDTPLDQRAKDLLTAPIAPMTGPRGDSFRLGGWVTDRVADYGKTGKPPDLDAARTEAVSNLIREYVPPEKRADVEAQLPASLQMTPTPLTRPGPSPWVPAAQPVSPPPAAAQESVSQWDQFKDKWKVAPQVKDAVDTAVHQAVDGRQPTADFAAPVQAMRPDWNIAPPSLPMPGTPTADFVPGQVQAMRPDWNLPVPTPPNVSLPDLQGSLPWGEVPTPDIGAPNVSLPDLRGALPWGQQEPSGVPQERVPGRKTRPTVPYQPEDSAIPPKGGGLGTPTLDALAGAGQFLNERGVPTPNIGTPNVTLPSGWPRPEITLPSPDQIGGAASAVKDAASRASLPTRATGTPGRYEGPLTMEGAPVVPGGKVKTADSGGGLQFVLDANNKYVGVVEPDNTWFIYPDDMTAHQRNKKNAEVRAALGAAPVGQTSSAEPSPTAPVEPPPESPSAESTQSPSTSVTASEMPVEPATTAEGKDIIPSTEATTVGKPLVTKDGEDTGLVLNSDGTVTKQGGGGGYTKGSSGGGYQRGSGGYSSGGSSYRGGSSSYRGKKKKKSTSSSFSGMWEGFPFNRPNSPIRQLVLDAIAASQAKGKSKK